MRHKIPFVAKRPDGAAPWKSFGSSIEEYEKWAPEVCAIACSQSLILAKHGKAPTLWELTQEAWKLGVFEEEAGEIKGAYHRPLAILLRNFGIEARLLKEASEAYIWNIANHGPIILSIDLEKLGNGLTGPHLVLVVDKDIFSEIYFIHDNARVLCPSGDNCCVSRAELAKISNGKGLCVRL